VLHIALGFPVRASCLTRRPWLATAPYLGAVVLAVPYQFGLHERSLYAPTHVIAVSAFGAALVTLIVSEVERYRRPATPGVRERIAILAVGAVLALSLPACLTLAEVLTGGRSPPNALALTTFLFPLAVGWAVLRDDLPEPVGPTKTC